MEFAVVIPARFGSTRLPGKMLADIHGKPMVIRVADQARLSGALEVIIATDHAAIADAADQHGHQAVLTRPEHQSGTDRLAEVAVLRGYPPHRIVVNVQGDEPLIEPKLIECVAQQLANHPDAALATACTPIAARDEFANPNVVKVVLDRFGFALYFSRAAIPYSRAPLADSDDTVPFRPPAFRHIGVYAYHAAFLSTYAKLRPAPIEQCEMLEQLRALWHGQRISVAVTSLKTHAGVDTAADLERVRRIVAGL